LRLGRIDLVGGRDDLRLLVDDLGVRLFDRLRLGDLFDQRLGVSAFGAVLMPLVICEKSASEMMSVVRNSSGGAFSGLIANTISVAPRTTPCSTADMVHPAFIPSGALLDLRH
jgi:hypothetical protein